MQPLDRLRNPVCSAKCVGTVPRDGLPHRISGSFDLNPELELPYYVLIFADGNPSKGMIREILVSPPDKFKKLSSAVYYIDQLIVTPTND